MCLHNMSMDGFFRVMPMQMRWRLDSWSVYSFRCFCAASSAAAAAAAGRAQIATADSPLATASSQRLTISVDVLCGLNLDNEIVTARRDHVLGYFVSLDGSCVTRL